MTRTRDSDRDWRARGRPAPDGGGGARPRRPEVRPARTAPLRAAQAAAQGSHVPPRAPRPSASEKRGPEERRRQRRPGPPGTNPPGRVPKLAASRVIEGADGQHEPRAPHLAGARGPRAGRQDLSGAAAACPQRSPVHVLITRTLGTVPGFRDPDWQAWWILLSDTQKPWVSCHNATNFG